MIVNGIFMWLLPGAETVPFHFIWISTALVYGWRTWTLPTTAVLLLVLSLFTGAALLHHADLGVIAWEEATEVPLMGGLFLVMVWHVRRRVAATHAVTQFAERERRAHDVQRRLVQVGSHELRTPITVARGHAELLRMDCETEGAVEDATIVLHELDKLGRIAGRLLALMQAGDTSAPAMDRIDAATLVERVVRRWRPSAARAWSTRVDPVVLFGDVDRLETAFDCLVENALKFSAPGSPVTLSAEATAGGCRLSVTDEGCGFEASRSAPPTGPSGRPGTGLGLAIVAAVAGAMGGEVVILPHLPAGSVVGLEVPTVGAGRSHPNGRPATARGLAPHRRITSAATPSPG